MADIKRVTDEFDPNRCQALIKGGTEQCSFVAIEGGNYCICHGGNKQRIKNETEDANLYRLSQYNARIQRLKGHNEAKGLQNELGILRMLLEERLNSCRDNVELILQSQQVSELVMKIEKLVTSTSKLEDKLGNYLSKTQLLSFAQKVIGIIQSELEDKPDTVERIANKLIATLSEDSDDD